MAISWDAKTDGSNTSTGTTLTWSHISTGTNLIGFVGIQSDFASDNITGVTWGGTSMTLVAKDQRGGNSRWTYLFYILGQSTGSQTIIATSNASGKYIEGGSVSYTGVNQSGQPDASSHAGATSASPSLAVTSVADNCWAIEWIITGGGALVAGSQPLRLSINSGAGMSNFYDTNGVVHPAGTTTFNPTISGTPNTYAAIAATFKPVSGTVYTLTAAEGSFTLTGFSALFNKALSLAAGFGSFALTGISVTINKGKILLASTGLFTLTGNIISFTGHGSWIWKNQSRNSSSYSNQSKNTTSFSNQTKSISSYSNKNKS